MLEMTQSSFEEVEKMSPRDAPAVIGAHWTTRLSRVADRVEPYAAKRRKPINRPLVDRHLPTVKRVGGKLVTTGRTKAAETIRSISYDVSSINDKDKLIREVATGQGKLRPVSKSYIPGKGFVPASQIPKTQLRSLAQGERKAGVARLKRQAAEHSTATREQNNAISRAHREMTGPPRLFDPNRPSHSTVNSGRKAYDRFNFSPFNAHTAGMLGDAKAAAFKHGGRRSKGFIAAKPDASDAVMRHETAHLTPKRSSYRMQNFNAGQLAREEARADMAGNHSSMRYKSSHRAISNKGEGSAYAMAAKNPVARWMTHKQQQAQGGQYKDMFSRENMKGYREVQNRIAASRTRKGQVQKSYIPGVGWKPITAATAKQKARIPGAHAKMHRVNRLDAAYQKGDANLRDAVADLPKKHFGVKLDRDSWTDQAGTYRRGSAKRGKSYVEGSATTRTKQKVIQAHEDQHAAPRRSGYRLHRQIHPNKQKLMREEARADYRSAGHYSNPRQDSGYAHVARRRDKALKQPNRPAKGSGIQARVMREYGETDWKRATNQMAYEGQAQRTLSTVGYTMSPKVRDRSVDAYRDLQNRMRAKGVPEGGVKKSFQPWDGVHSEVSKMGPDQSELHVAGSSNQKRKARLRKLPPDATRRVC